MPYANNGGVNIYYEVEGEGQPLVMMHGFSMTLHMWRATGYVDELNSNYRLILVDARGHGKSDKPHEVDGYDSEKRAGDVIAVLDALKIDSTNYLGNSMGGRLGYEIAKYFPSRVNSLIIGASNAAGEVVLENDERLTVFEKGMESYIEFLERTGPLSPDMKAGMLANDNQALYAVMKAGWPDTERYLPEMRMPFLLFAGEQAPEYYSMKEVSKVLPDAKFISVPEAGHGAVWARRDLILPHIKEFLARVNKGV